MLEVVIIHTDHCITGWPDSVTGTTVWGWYASTDGSTKVCYQLRIWWAETVEEHCTGTAAQYLWQAYYVELEFI